MNKSLEVELIYHEVYRCYFYEGDDLQFIEKNSFLFALIRQLIKISLSSMSYSPDNTFFSLIVAVYTFILQMSVK